jgi:hypothetical protein
MLGPITVGAYLVTKILKNLIDINRIAKENRAQAKIVCVSLLELSKKLLKAPQTFENLIN